MEMEANLVDFHEQITRLVGSNSPGKYEKINIHTHVERAQSLGVIYMHCNSRILLVTISCNSMRL